MSLWYLLLRECHALLLRWMHWAINEISVLWLVRVWILPSPLWALETVHLLSCFPGLWSFIYSRIKLSNRLEGHSIFLMLFLRVAVSSVVVRPTNYNSLGFYKIQFSSARWNHSVLNWLQAESQDDHGTQLFCFFSLSSHGHALPVVQCLKSIF